jgi:hypothetical protein
MRDDTGTSAGGVVISMGIVLVGAAAVAALPRRGARA